MLAGLEQTRNGQGSVVVIRYEGPKSSPGMPEMLTPTSAIMGAGLGKDMAMLTDGRFSRAAGTGSSSAASRQRRRTAGRSR